LAYRFRGFSPWSLGITVSVARQYFVVEGYDGRKLLTSWQPEKRETERKREREREKRTRAR
jgi:hypothetical protein